MIPLRDNIPSRRFPVANLALILANAGIFLWMLPMSLPAKEQLWRMWGMVPQEVYTAMTHPGPGQVHAYLTLVTATFFHGGWLHILGNMVFLWVFGDNVEDTFGSYRYLGFYLAAGTAANLVQVWSAPASLSPTIGASGAVAGVLGAYFMRYPRARVLSLIFLGIFVTVLEIPAVFFLLYWFALQLLNGVISLRPGLQSGVAWWAHVGGFVTGAVLLLLWRPREKWRT